MTELLAFVMFSYFATRLINYLDYSSCVAELLPFRPLGWIRFDTSASPVVHLRVIRNKFACIPIAAVHNNTGSVRVRVTLKYKQLL